MKNALQFRDRISKMRLPASSKALALAVALVSVGMTRYVQAQDVFTVLHSFSGTDGYTPEAALVQAANGNLYGTTVYGGNGSCEDGSCGTVFEITLSGALTTLHNFEGPDGYWPFAGLMQATNGELYGTTYEGGANGQGVVFAITPEGKFATLVSFSDPTDGAAPPAGLIQSDNGLLYGTTVQGVGSYAGEVFKMTPSGKLTVLYNFMGSPNGDSPTDTLVQATNGIFYGTTSQGGTGTSCPEFCGTVFAITSSGRLTTLHSFNGTDGESPYAGLIQASNGIFYGTTSKGGANGDGTIFAITSSGRLTTLHSFNGTDGANPYAGLIQATDGQLYGMTITAGAHGYGTIFKISLNGSLTTLHNFNGTDGANPGASLIQATDGNFYGTTGAGGASNSGTVFSFSAGLASFVRTLPASGKVGDAVKILGTNLAGATSVSFNGKTAVFSVDSSSAITATVPADATTGKIEVSTPLGTLISNANFLVTPLHR
jgi:uncharacterized repeat protein (TIGR03803 family)